MTEASTELALYDAAVRAIEAAAATDDVLEIRNQAIAWAAYRRQAEDRTLEVKAMHIRFRAERRLGELLKRQRETVGLAKGGQPYQGGGSTCAETEQVETRAPTLKEAKIDRKLSSRAQRMAEMPLEQFEARLKRHQAEALGGAPKVSADLLRVDKEEEGRAHRRNLAAELSAQTAELPQGRAFPAWYVDLPWERKGGITDRSYENHYPTMTWPQILEFLRRARPLLLPDAWGFFWIPRAHLLALVEVEIEAPIAATGELVTVKVDMPLAWAVAHAAGFDRYSTCFVWTKTDAEHPDESGSGILAYDQDELLLLFKRGQGLPKPATDEKYGSNHRERARLLGHSRKPEHYRRMIVDMVGKDLAGEPLPVMEFFARVDADNPLPRNWSAWGNQSAAIESGAAHAPPDKEYPEDGSGTAREAPSTLWESESAQADSDLGTQSARPLSIADEDPATSSPAAAAPAEGGAAATPVPLEIGELEALKAFSDFCYPRRDEICAQLGAEYQEKGFATEQGGTGQWILREAGRARLDELLAAIVPAAGDGLGLPDFLRREPGKRPPTARPQFELDLARIDRAPPEVVDEKLQTRLPLTADEIDMQLALQAIDRGEVADTQMVRHLHGAGFIHCTLKRCFVTDEGRAFLVQLVAPAPAEAVGAQA